MDYRELRKSILSRNALAEEHAKTPKVIETLSQNDGCPCNQRTFIYWVGKHHKTRSDYFQVHLIEAILQRTDLFLKIPGKHTLPKNKHECIPYYTASYICLNCHNVWEKFSVEWTMLNPEHSLRRTDIGDPSDFYPNLCGNSGYARSSSKNQIEKSIKFLNFEEWRTFLLSDI